jgi:hypothetical protein
MVAAGMAGLIAAACGGRAAPADGGGVADDGAGGFDAMPPDVGPGDVGSGTPCRDDCDCVNGDSQLICFGTRCGITLSLAFNRCCHAPFCPTAAICVMPDGSNSRCPGACGQLSNPGDCEAGLTCQWTVCPGCAGASDTGMCTDPRSPVACADLCRASDCHTIPEGACRGTVGCRPVYCPACNGTHPYMGCLDLHEPSPCAALSCPADGGAGDAGDLGADAGTDLADVPDVMTGDGAGG